MKRWDGVADGTRTHDDQNHNLGLYQLSYSHRRGRKYSGWPLAPAPHSASCARREGGAGGANVQRDAADAAPSAAADGRLFTSTLKRVFSAS